MSDAKRRMSAYYYRFDPTGIEAIDKVLGAVACAGKAFHLTADWNDECGPYDDHTGATPIEWIQNAAVEAGDEIDRLRTENERLREALHFIERWTVYKRYKPDGKSLTAEEAIGIIAHCLPIREITKQYEGNGEIDQAAYEADLARMRAALAAQPKENSDD